MVRLTTFQKRSIENQEYGEDKKIREFVKKERSKKPKKEVEEKVEEGKEKVYKKGNKKSVSSGGEKHEIFKYRKNLF